MGRRKLENKHQESKKKQTRVFIKRKDGIMKKAKELSKLCGIDLCLITFGPNEDQPHIWPTEPEKINSIISKYQNTSIEKRGKRATNLSSYPKERQEVPSNQQIGKTVKEALWDDPTNSFPDEKLMELVNCLDSKIGIVNARIDSIKKSQTLAKLEEVHYLCGGKDHGMNMMDMNMMDHMVMPNMQYQYPIDDQYIIGDQRNTKIMTTMMNGGGLMGEHVNDATWNPSPSAWNYNQISSNYDFTII